MSGKSSSTKPAPGSSFAAAGKQYSQESSKALRKLNSIDKKFEGMVDRVDKVAQDTKYDEKEGVVPLLKAKNELAQIVGDLERLQFKELDAVETSGLNSGKADARSQRKSLNNQVENLLRRTQNLHNDFVSTVEKIQSGKLSLQAPVASVVPPSPVVAAVGEKRKDKKRDSSSNSNNGSAKSDVRTPKSLVEKTASPAVLPSTLSTAAAAAVIITEQTGRDTTPRSVKRRKKRASGAAETSAPVVPATAAIEKGDINDGRRNQKKQQEQGQQTGDGDVGVDATAKSIETETSSSSVPYVASKKRDINNNSSSNINKESAAAAELAEMFVKNGGDTRTTNKKRSKKQSKKNTTTETPSAENSSTLIEVTATSPDLPIAPAAVAKKTKARTQRKSEADNSPVENTDAAFTQELRGEKEKIPDSSNKKSSKKNIPETAPATTALTAAASPVVAVAALTTVPSNTAATTAESPSPVKPKPKRRRNKSGKVKLGEEDGDATPITPK